MGRSLCNKVGGISKGPWTEAEDALLTAYIKAYGDGNWRLLPMSAGLSRCGKSCRLRWMNYLRPGLKRGKFSWDEEDLIVKLHALLGNRWSLIAGRIPGRTDNEIKNYWNTHLSRKLRNKGIDPCDHKIGQLTATSKDAADKPNSEVNACQFNHEQATASAENCTSRPAYDKHDFPGSDSVRLAFPHVNTTTPAQASPFSSPYSSSPNSESMSDGSCSSGDDEYPRPKDENCCMDERSASNDLVVKSLTNCSHHYTMEQQSPISNADMSSSSFSFSDFLDIISKGFQDNEDGLDLCQFPSFIEV